MNNYLKIRKKIIEKFKILPFLKNIYYYFFGRDILKDPEFLAQEKNYLKEKEKKITRTQIINFIISKKNKDTYYLEIGVRNRASNFDLVNANYKYSVDPAINLNDKNHFQLTSDSFFINLKC